MLICFKSGLVRLPGSYYNNNFFEMPVEFDGCDILFEHCDEMTNELHYQIGHLNENGKFEPRYYFAPEREIIGNDDRIYFDLSTASKENLWT